MATTPAPSDMQASRSAAPSQQTLVRGGSFMFAGQLLRTGVTIGSNIVVARLLSPNDYGLFGMAAVVSGFLLQFASFRVHLAVIQCKDVSDAQLSTLFWAQLIWSSFLAVACWASGPLITLWFHEPTAAKLLAVLGLTLPLNAAYGWHLTLLRRQLQFRTVATIDLVAYTLATLLVVVGAWSGLGYWALAIGVVGERIVGAIITWTQVPWRPGRPQRGSGVRSFIAFGGNLTASGLLSYATRNVDNAMIGWRWGAASLGEYARAYAVFISPLSQLFPPLHEVMVPILSRVQDRDEELLRLFTLAVRVLAWLTMPLTVLILVAADPLIVVLLGEKWRGSAPILQWLCVGGTVQTIHAALGWLYIARAQARAVLRFGSFAAIVTILSFLAGLPFGPRYVAAAYSLAVWGLAAAYYWHAQKVTGLDLRPTLRAVVWPLFSCALLLPAGLLLGPYLANRLGPLLQGIALALLAGVICGSVLLLSGEARQALQGIRIIRQSRAG
jgi:O-antigen/teichoic acid export membrane protein